MKISCEICPLYTACDYGYDMPCPESVEEAFEKYPELCDCELLDCFCVDSDDDFIPLPADDPINEFMSKPLLKVFDDDDFSF